MRFARRRHEAHRQAAGAGAAGAADAVHIVDGRARQVVVHHHRELRDVDAARRQVGGDQHVPLSVLEFGEHLLARALAHVAVERRGEDAGLVQLPGHVLGGVTGRDEHQHPLPVVFLDQVAQQFGAALLVDLDRPLRDGGLGGGRRRHVQPQRVAQQAVRQRLHRGRERGREEQALPLRRHQPQHPVQFLGKTQVEQAVGLVEHQHFDRRQPQGVVLHQIEQAPGRGHHHVGAAAQRHHLRVDRDAAEDHRHLQRLRRRVRMRQPAHALRRPARPARAWAPGSARGCGAAAACGPACSRCSIGSAKAAVLPEPVWAQPWTSAPRSTAGIACDWIGVGVTKPSSAAARTRTGERPSKEKGMGRPVYRRLAAAARSSLRRERLHLDFDLRVAIQPGFHGGPRGQAGAEMTPVCVVGVQRRPGTSGPSLGRGEAAGSASSVASPSTWKVRIGSGLPLTSAAGMGLRRN